MEVRLREGETFDSLLRRFRSHVAKHGILAEYRQHQAFMSKSQRARLKARKAQRRQARRQARRAA